MKKLILTNHAIEKAVKRMRNVMVEIPDTIVDTETGENKTLLIYGVPRGGVFVAHALADGTHIRVTDSPHTADIIVDDIVATGATLERYQKQHPDKRFMALASFIQTGTEEKQWYVFPWEVTEGGHDESAADIVTRLIDYIGEDAKRGGLVETPKRVLKAWEEWTSGYNQDPADVMKSFEDGAESYDEMVLVKDLPFYSHCEHHMAPFFGTATIAYIPTGKVAGLSKLGRILNIFAKRLQVQERLTSQVAGALYEGLDPRGVGVLIKARHLCMESRGLNCQGHHTITSALKGNFLTEPAVRSEFLSLAK